MSDNGTGTLILIRLAGEVAIKSRQTRRHFQRRLVRNLEDALECSGVDFEVREGWGRLWVAASSQAALDVVSRVFGIASISLVEATAKPELAAIIQTGDEVYADRVRGRTFAVRARRAGRHAFSSRDINYDLGAALDRHGDVDLGNPDVTVHVEVREDAAYFFSARIAGAGGLPLGVEGRAVALISGGYDSAVAAWMMMKRGVALDYVFCNLAGRAYERAVLSVAKTLSDEWGYGTRPQIHVIDFQGTVEHLSERVRRSYWQVILKRLMYRAAERVAHEIAAKAIVTGESVGQVSSQTLSNLCVIGDSVTTPVLRPLVGFDKEEIIRRSRDIGTYPLSEKVREYCALVERHPVTDAAPRAVARQEAKLDLAVLEDAVAGRRVLDLRSLAASDLVTPYLYTSEIPDGAMVIDTRSEEQYGPWHYPGASRRGFWDLFRDFKRLERDRTYVLYCELGLKTAQLAEKMQRAGFEAYSFKGGVPALRAYVESTEPGLRPTRTP